jgi:hypothetical protein
MSREQAMTGEVTAGGDKQDYFDRRALGYRS